MPVGGLLDIVDSGLYLGLVDSFKLLLMNYLMWYSQIRPKSTPPI